MGNCTTEEELSELELYTPQLAQYKLLYIIGRGGFGRVQIYNNQEVWKVKQQKKYYAMKEMYKAKIIQKSSVHSIMNERNLLEKLNHPFLVNMKSAFQTSQNLYIVLDLMEGGDLRYHMCRQRIFTEEQTKFFVICILIALEYLHCNLILHRDLKPENLVFESSGYLRLTDMGIARIWRPNNKQDTSGTPGYMAPEVMLRQNHGVASDYFALGVITYECLTGKRPYQGRSRRSIKEGMIAKQAKLHRSTGLSQNVIDFVNRLIERKQSQRLGFEGPEDVMQHKWLKDVNWDSYRQKKIQAPFKIVNSDNFDPKFTQKMTEVEKISFDDSQFRGYTFINEEQQIEITEMGTNRQTQVQTKIYASTKIC